MPTTSPANAARAGRAWTPVAVAETHPSRYRLLEYAVVPPSNAKHDEKDTSGEGSKARDC